MLFYLFFIPKIWHHNIFWQNKFPANFIHFLYIFQLILNYFSSVPVNIEKDIEMEKTLFGKFQVLFHEKCGEMFWWMRKFLRIWFMEIFQIFYWIYIFSSLHLCRFKCEYFFYLMEFLCWIFLLNFGFERKLMKAVKTSQSSWFCFVTFRTLEGTFSR